MRLGKSRLTITAATVLLAATALFAEGYYIEAETQSASSWVKKSEKPGYTGSGYLQYTGSDTRSTNKGVLAYSFEVKKAGNYIVTLRGRRDKEGGCKSVPNDHCNDVFSKMNNGSWHKTMIKGNWGSWFWESRYIKEPSEANVKPAKYSLKAGKNTFYVSPRSQGMKFDAMTIHLEGTSQPKAGAATSLVPAERPLPMLPQLDATTARYNILGRYIGEPNTAMIPYRLE